MKLKLSEEQLRLLMPFAHGLVVYAGMQMVFIISIAIGVEHLAVMFGIGWLCIESRQAEHAELNKQFDNMQSKVNRAIRDKHIEGDEWKDN